MTEAERQWTQEELRAYLLQNGYKPEDFRPGEHIPQGVKFIDFSPPTEAESVRARQLIREHPEWETAMRSRVDPEAST